MSIVDEETRQLILRKTWCHGQAILPIYSIALLTWWWHFETRPFQLVLASVVLPIWAWYSYHAVIVIDQNGTLPYTKICGFGVVAMVAHLLVLMVTIQELADTGHMLMAIASGLFFVETGAFLLVVTTLRHEITTSQNEPLNRDDNFY
mmetsp:Transcript_13406/g.29117  ORF Transcript_13406/g.29117 Transcript_13406/m.29117 type:complete len:148 (-) Transcript_13406:1236-1679(-)